MKLFVNIGGQSHCLTATFVFIGLAYLMFIWPSYATNNQQPLTLSFIDFIKNPCGFLESSSSSTAPSSLVQTPSKTTLESTVPVNDGMELLHASQLAFVFVRDLETSFMAISECNGISLNSLSPIPDLKSMSMGVSMVSICKVLINYLAHVHFITSQHDKLNDNCKNHAVTIEFCRLSGKLQYLLCNVMQTLPNYGNVMNQAFRELYKRRIRFQSSCSAIEMQECLVLKGTRELLATITDHLENHLSSSLSPSPLSTPSSPPTPPVDNNIVPKLY